MPEPPSPPKGLSGQALKSWEAAEERRQAEAARQAERDAQFRALARLVARKYTPDELRNLGEDGAAVLRLAGLPAPVTEPEHAVPPQHTVMLNDVEAGDPAYDQGYLDLYCRLGGAHPDVRAKYREVLERWIAEDNAARADAEAAGRPHRPSAGARRARALLAEVERAEEAERRPPVKSVPLFNPLPGPVRGRDYDSSPDGNFGHPILPGNRVPRR